MSIFLPLLGKVVNHYKGFAGAVKSVQCGSQGTEELVAACGLDRYLRVYTLHPPKLKQQVLYAAAILFKKGTMSRETALSRVQSSIAICQSLL